MLQFNNKWLIFLWGIIFFNYNAFAQNVVIKHFGVNEGLPSSETYYVTKDSKGYLWVATDAGVVKYDGYKFKSYSTRNGLPDNTVFKIHEDSKSRIWFSSYSGRFSYYDSNTDSIIEIPANTELIKTIKTLPLEFAFDDSDTLFVSVDNKGYLKIFPPFYDKFEHIKYSYDCVFLKYVTNDKIISGKNFVNSFPLMESIPLVYDVSKKNNGRSVLKLGTIKEFGSFVSVVSKKEKLYLSTYKKIYSIQNNQLNEIKHDTPENIIDINSINITDTKLWVNTIKFGTYVFEKQFSKSLNLLNNYSVSCVLDDKDDGIWISTLEDGLFHVPDLGFNYLDKSAGLTANKILSIEENKEGLYCLTSDYNFQSYDINSDEINEVNFLKQPYWGLKKLGDIYVVYGSPSFITGNDFKIKAEITCIVNSEKQVIKIKDVDFFDHQNFLAASGGGLYLVDKNTGKAIMLQSGLPNIFSICNTPNGVYLGTKSGVYLYNKKACVFLGDNNTLFKSRVEDIHFVNGNLYFATRGNGVLILKANGDVLQFNQNNGLASDIVRCLTSDENLNVWVGTNRGITKLSYTGNNMFKVISFNLANGLVSSEINKIIIKNGHMFFATNKGLGKVSLSNVLYGKSKIPVNIESVLINNQIYNLKSTGSLDYNQNMIVVNYKGLRVINSGNILYKYRLAGLDTNWVYTNNTTVQFTTLPPGNYKFEVYAINSESNASILPATFQFTINKPFWKTWWFIFGSLFLLSITLYFLYLNKIKSVKKKEQEKAMAMRAQVESELKALRAQMNPHFIFNAINSIQSFVLKNESKIAQSYLTKFARLIRLVLENSKHNFISLSNEIESLNLYIELEALRSSFSFDFKISANDNINADLVSIPPMLLQPYIENAILHGLNPLVLRKGNLVVVFSRDEKGRLKCVIEDNGIGRNKAMEIKRKKDLNRKSMGMEVTGDRIHLLNAHTDFFADVVVIDKIENNEPFGTRVEITIDIKDYKND